MFTRTRLQERYLLTPTAKCLEIVYITIIEHLMFILFLHSRFAFN